MEGVQYATEHLGKSREQLLRAPEKNEVAGPKQKQCPAMNVSDGESKV